jgi:hypothetical protein
MANGASLTAQDSGLATRSMPVGSPMTLPLRPEQVSTTEGNERPAVWNDDATANLVWNDYQRAKAYVEAENTSWLLEWQETDILYQSPIPYRFERLQNGRTARVPRFLVAKMTRTLARGVKRSLFAEQYPFLLRPGARGTQQQVDAWTYLLGVLLKRARLPYHAGLQINGQTLFGTGLGKFGIEERTLVKKTRRRKKPPAQIPQPTGPAVTLPTEESDDFKAVESKVSETWPFYEYRKLGTTLFDPKWCTPDLPGESAGYCVDIDYVNFYDLQEMRQLSCYAEKKGKDDDGKEIILSAGIPSEEILKQFFFEKSAGAAPVGTQTEDAMSSMGSMVTHAAARNRQTTVDPLGTPLLMIERWDDRTVRTILCYEGEKLVIRNEEHDCESLCHTSCTWWPIENCGYGMGIGRIVGPDQRVNQGTLNEALKMIAYPMNAPILYARGAENAPTQNTVWRMGGYQAVDPGPSGDVRKGMAFMEMPAIPREAFELIDRSQRGAEELSGADAQMQQGVQTGRQGATRSSFGAQRMAAMSDQNIADPVDSFANGVLIPFLEFLVRWVKTKMPVKEIREILSQKYSAEILQVIDLEQLLDAEFEIAILAGQKLAAKQGIQQVIPFYLQLLEQPQILEYYHQIGKTVDFAAMEDIFMAVSELTQQPDIIRTMTPRERALYRQNNPNMQKVQAATAVEKVKGQNKLQEVAAKNRGDLTKVVVDKALDKMAGGEPLDLAEGRLLRNDDQQALEGGLPGNPSA